MSACDDSVALEAVVGSVLDTSSGVTATSLLPLLDGKAALIGTNKGSVLFCTSPSDASDTLQPASDIVLHCGAVYDMALSSQHLVATAGHDAVACVFPLHALFHEGGPAQCRRLTGHTVPVVAVMFLADGTTLVTLGADGAVRIVDVVHGDVLAVLSSGFASTCVACSVDETTLFVGGRSLAAFDLYPAMRPSSFQSSAAAEVWGAASTQTHSGGEARNHGSAGVRLYQWTAAAAAANGDDAKAARVSRTAPGVVITKLTVSAEDNSLTAVFARGGAQPCGQARWSSGGGRIADQTWWEAAAPDTTAPSRAISRVGAVAVSVRCKSKTSARPPVKHAAPASPASSSGTASAAAALWHGRWYTSPFELSGDVEAAVHLAEGFSTCSDVPAMQQDVTGLPLYPAGNAPLTLSEEVAKAEVDCDELQRECDALVFQIRSMRAGSA